MHLLLTVQFCIHHCYCRVSPEKKTLLTYLLTYTFVLSIRAPGHTCFSVLLYFLVTQGHPHGWRSLSQV